MTRADPGRTGIRRRVLADHVYDELLESLIDGRYQADTPLNIDALSRELEVSPTPVREALARLESTGLVLRTALKGYRVAPLFTSRDLEQLTDARMVIEPVNAFLAAQHVDDEFLGRLEETIEALEVSPRGPSFASFRRYWEADERFHQLIAERADNRFLYSAFLSLGGQVQRFRLFAGLGVTDAEFAIAEHRAIVAGLASRDPEAARVAMADHIHGVKERSLRDRQRRD